MTNKTHIAPALANAMAAQAGDNAITAEYLEPAEDKIVVRRIIQTRIGNLHLPEGSANKTPFATVLAVGPGRQLDNGTRTVVKAKVGQIILLPYGVQETKINDDVVIILRDVDVNCFVKQSIQPTS